jgi:hypothetical protein
MDAFAVLAHSYVLAQRFHSFEDDGVSERAHHRTLHRLPAVQCEWTVRSLSHSMLCIYETNDCFVLQVVVMRGYWLGFSMVGAYKKAGLVQEGKSSIYFLRLSTRLSQNYLPL